MKLVARDKEAKAKQINLDLVKDHFIPHIVDKIINKKAFDALVYFEVLVFLSKCYCKTSFQQSASARQLQQ